MKNENNVKQKILDLIEETVSVFERRGTDQYRIRCPFCGDNQKDPKDAHCYIKCSQDPTEPILYNCFKCPAGGILGKSFLERLGINSPDIKMLNATYNKLVTYKPATVEVLTGSPNLDSNQLDYIEYRLGTGFTYQDLDNFKVVWDINLVKPHISNRATLENLPNNNDSITFISDDKTMLLSRSFSDNGQRWKKQRMFGGDIRSFYTVKSMIDLFTEGPITVNIGEGVFDVLAVYKNYNSGDNSLYLAVLGKDYEIAIDYILSKGIVGKNVDVKVYIDSNIDPKATRRQFKKYKWMFNSISILRNGKADDFGHKAEEIFPIELRV